MKPILIFAAFAAGLATGLVRRSLATQPLPSRDAYRSGVPVAGFPPIVRPGGYPVPPPRAHTSVRMAALDRHPRRERTADYLGG